MRLFVPLILALILASGCEPPARKRQTGTRTAIPDKPYIVYDFWAEWCPPCMKFAPTFEEVRVKFEKRTDVAFVRVNVDEDPETMNKFRIESIPTVVVTASGKEVTRFSGSGYIDKPEAFERELLKLLPAAANSAPK